MYIGKGHTYQKEVAEAVTQGLRTAFWSRSPPWSICSAISTTPTQCMADMLHIIHHFGGVGT